ncbi:PepSY domain-containing protein [Sphingopyxis sp. KK2]|uniref:PepSY domain-containing protein n=1 Tax=Sphingopyxis sp. KK2 TaxID=1855727 RepID=UPI00097E73E7|nr:PepSY domain-containing protein [Sphingopyxis sp. KK2]
MKYKLPLILLAATGIIATSATVAARPAPAEAKGQAYWSETRWDDDDDDRRHFGAMPVPNADALRQAGMVRVQEVDRDDGRIEVEGYDARGRELEIRMDARGQRILSIDRDDDLDDRWDD